MWIDVDELVRILSAGVNVVTSASFITGAQPRRRPRPDRGGVQAGRLDDVRLRRQPRVRRPAGHRRGDRLRPGGQGDHRRVGRHHPLRLTRHRAARGLRYARSTIPTCSRSVGKARRCSPKRCSSSPIRSASNSTRSCVRPSTRRRPRTSRWLRGPSRPATWRAVFASWQGRVGGKTVVDLNVRWRKGQTLEPDWKLDGDGWKITIEGRPTVNMQVGFLPPQDMIENAKTIEDFFVLGHIMTAMPPIHAIPAVVAAAPGIATYNDLPLPQARGVGARQAARCRRCPARSRTGPRNRCRRRPGPIASGRRPPTNRRHAHAHDRAHGRGRFRRCTAVRTGRGRGAALATPVPTPTAPNAKPALRTKFLLQVLSVNHVRISPRQLFYGARRRNRLARPVGQRGWKVTSFRRPRITISLGTTARESSLQRLRTRWFALN